MEEQRGPAIGVAVITVAFFAVMAAAIVALGWVAFTVYAIVKMIGSAPDHPNPDVIALVIVGVVTLLAIGLMSAVLLAGRSMVRRKRREARAA